MTGTVTLFPKRTAERGRLMLVTMSLARSGGAEAQVGDIAIGMAKRGWDVEVVCLLDWHMSPEFAAAGIRTTSLSMNRGFDFGALRRFIAHVRERRPDVVHSHMTHPNLLARAARPFCPMPVLVCTLHGYKMYSVRSGSYLLRELAHMVTDRLADRTTVVCEAAAERYVRNRVISRDRLLTIPNGIDADLHDLDEGIRVRTRKSLGLRDELVWLAAGRLEPVKDYATMLRGFAQSLDVPVKQMLLIAGDGSQTRSMQYLAAELGIGSRVRFLGLRNDVPALMQAADGFVLSSVYEGLPLALLQAGASGLPLVATRVGGNREAMSEGEGGWLVPPRSPKDLARAMRRVALLTDVERVQMGWAARDFVRRRFRSDMVLDTWEALYREMSATALRDRVGV